MGGGAKQYVCPPNTFMGAAPCPLSPDRRLCPFSRSNWQTWVSKPIFIFILTNLQSNEPWGKTDLRNIKPSEYCILSISFVSHWFTCLFEFVHVMYQIIRCWSPNVTCSVVMVSWFKRNYCACAPMLYISELCEDCAVANEIDYAWASIHDNGHVIKACDVWLQ